MPIEFSPKGFDPARASSAVSTRSIAPVRQESHPARTAGATGEPVVARSIALDPGEPPVDTDRVTQIRRAVESGTYPLVPAKMADAMIAAGMLLRSGK